MSKLFGKLLIDALRHLDDLPDDRVYRDLAAGDSRKAPLQVLRVVQGEVAEAAGWRRM